MIYISYAPTGCLYLQLVIPCEVNSVNHQEAEATAHDPELMDYLVILRLFAFHHHSLLSFGAPSHFGAHLPRLYRAVLLLSSPSVQPEFLEL